MPGLYRFFRQRPLCRRWHTCTPSDLGCASVCGHIDGSSEAPLELCTRALESGISWQEPQALSNQGSPLLFQRRDAEGSRVSELSADTTPWGPCDHSGLQRGPACLSGCAQPIHCHPKGSRIGIEGGREMTPAGVLNLPLPCWKSAQGGPEDGTPGGLILGRRLRPPLSRSPSRTPDVAAAKAAAGEPLAPSVHRRRLKGTQPDWRQGSAGRPSQCACAWCERVLASQWFPRLSGKPRPEAWPTGALRGSAWVAGLRGSSLISPRGLQDSLRMPGVPAKD